MDILDKLNETNETLQSIGDKIDTFFYWINPFEWVPDLLTQSITAVNSGSIDYEFLAISMILIWLIVFGCKWAKKLMFWGWVVFWIIRGVSI